MPRATINPPGSPARSIGARVAHAWIAATVASCALATSASAAALHVTDRGDGGPGSLREAIIAANASPEADTITIGVTGVIELHSALDPLDGQISITGPDADELTVRRQAPKGQFRIFTIAPAANISIAGLTVKNGLSAGVPAEAEGGGIHNRGTLTLQRAAVVGNTATTLGDTPPGPAAGGGIYNGPAATLTISQTTISGNLAQHSNGVAEGGGIFNAGTLTIENSTIAENIAMVGGGGPASTARGGGIASADTATLRSATLATNEVKGPAGQDAGADLSAPSGSLTIQNTAIADGKGAAECDLGVATSLTSLGFNLDQGTSCRLSHATDHTNTDPRFAPLKDYGGPTKTMEPTEGSPVIDKGIAAGLAFDQRGFARPSDRIEIPNAPGGDGSDIGAVEFNAPPATCKGKAVTVVAIPGVPVNGTGGDDVIRGTGGRDVIRSRSGDDTVCARAGDDNIRSGGGSDAVAGGRGGDAIKGGGGGDRIVGGDGGDRIKGNGGGDRISGADGGDRLRGNGGGDRLSGGADDDRIKGGSRPDSLRGGPGDDLLSGGTGRDRCGGGTGRDRERSC